MGNIFKNEYAVFFYVAILKKTHKVNYIFESSTEVKKEYLQN